MMVTDSVTTSELGPKVLKLMYGRRRQLAQNLAQHVVHELADEELPLFERRARAHFRPRLWRRKPLAMDGWGLSTDMVTPAALSAAAAVVGAMSAELVTRFSARAVKWAFEGRRQSRARPLEGQLPVEESSGGRSGATRAETGSQSASATALQRYRTAALAGARLYAGEELAQQIADSALARFVDLLAEDETVADPASAPTALLASAPQAVPESPGEGGDGSPAAGA
ncbi:hypothetical protein [Streptomyces avermitilis]|uniref:hypothetical protein n=1 Tax=Streptomyces avermitilis TaxID=33903 RepID=UPI00371F1C0E